MIVLFLLAVSAGVLACAGLMHLCKPLPALILISACALPNLARAEALHCEGKRCRVVEWTADKLIREQRLTCKPVGNWQSETLADGSTVIRRGKVCFDGHQ